MVSGHGPQALEREVLERRSVKIPPDDHRTRFRDEQVRNARWIEMRCLQNKRPVRDFRRAGAPGYLGEPLRKTDGYHRVIQSYLRRRKCRMIFPML